MRIHLAALGMVIVLATAANAQDISCGAPPPAKPQRIKGGESFPPLPLPVTPVRRTERKRPPAPPVLIGKLAYGQKVSATTPEGTPYTYQDWKSDPADAHNLLQFACPKLGIQYRPEIVQPDEFSWDPSRTPILYLTGHQALTVPLWAGDRLLAYVVAGGTVVADACCGSAAFADSLEEFIKGVFPYRRLAPLPPDHPLFHCFFDINEVTYRNGTEVIRTGPPELLAIEIGCRAAVLFARYDVSCGWDGHVHPTGPRIEPKNALELGTNILAYALSCQSLGRFLARTKTYHEENTPAGGDEFVFGQLVHQGDWDPDPSAVANLLKAVNTNTTIDVKFVRRNINPDRAELFDVPFLYMTGHHDFAFTEGEAGNLRAYLLDGGFLFADACCGRKAFDAAFRAQMARILPERPLEQIPPDDPLFSSLYSIQQVRYMLQDQTVQPRLYGIKVDGYYVVVYSPDDLGNGWEDEPHPYVDGVAPDDALRLAMNVIMYALTH